MIGDRRTRPGPTPHRAGGCMGGCGDLWYTNNTESRSLEWCSPDTSSRPCPLTTHPLLEVLDPHQPNRTFCFVRASCDDCERRVGGRKTARHPEVRSRQVHAAAREPPQRAARRRLDGRAQRRRVERVHRMRELLLAPVGARREHARDELSSAAAAHTPATRRARRTQNRCRRTQRRGTAERAPKKRPHHEGERRRDDGDGEGERRRAECVATASGAGARRPREASVSHGRASSKWAARVDHDTPRVNPRRHDHETAPLPPISPPPRLSSRPGPHARRALVRLLFF